MADRIDLYDLYTSFNGLVNSFQGGFYPPVTVFTPAVNNISNEMWEAKTALAENSQKNMEDLQPFLRTKNCIVTNAGLYGTFNNPADYGYYSAARLIVHNDTTVCEDGQEVWNNCEQVDEQTQYEMIERYKDGVTEVNVDKITSGKWASCLSSLTKPPTLAKPKITMTDTGYKVAPRKVSVVVMDYYVKPTDATFVYSITNPNVQTGAGDQIIYSKAQSTPLQWSTTLINEFLWRLAERFGITTKDNFLAQYSAARAKQVS